MYLRTLFLLAVTCGLAAAQTVTPLWSRGYSVIPTPRTVHLGDGDITLDSTWTLIDKSTAPIAAKSLAADFANFHGVTLRRVAGAKSIRLSVAPGTVKTGADPELDAQAYRLRIDDNVIEIIGNADAGLFYGVQSLIQLPKRDSAGRLLVPKLTIEDWPKLQLRFLHWDTKHHQDRMATIKRYLDWTARFKANMIGFELEDKFEYPSNPEIGAPGAFTTAQLQEIVNYGLERHIQVVPVIQAPAHLAYVLKHPKFAHLRADGNNYQSALCDPRTYDLIFSMFDDVIKATKGVKYLFASTDEVYYAGIEATCRPYNEENRSLAWVEYVKRARDHVAKQGRRMLVWDEYPLLTKHVDQLPPDVIAGVIGEPEYIPIQNRLGMRQLAYVSMQGAEYVFPNSITGEGGRGGGGGSRGHLQSAYESIAHGKHWQAKPIGGFGAA
ncbi:MAG: beta-N-acetylhexosaminidase, partial [Acidobacteria bacterium]|nr:beta-N-acetylhexosaminidase [Acidobacteriota bacterium]